MATTVRVDQEVKKELDHLQGHLQSETGERLSHSMLLARLVRFARRHEAKFLDETSDRRWRPPTQAELAKHRLLVQDWGVETDAARIDEVLYGGESP